MAGNTYYSTGTASVSNGGTTVTGSGTAWASVVQAGDLFIVPAQGLVAMITAVASNTSITIDAWPGTTISGAAYKIVFASDAIRQSERARRYAEIASQIENTGIGIDAFGDFVDRDAYDTQVAGYAFLSFDGDGDTITEPVIFIKNSSTSADWSAAVEIVGPQGAQGETGLIGVWEGPWLTATAYAVGDAVSQGGSSYICVEAHTSGTFSTDLAASKWELVAAKGDTGATGTNGTDGIDGTGLFSRVRAVAASNITIATALNDGDTLDGVTLATNDLVLVAGQSAPAENGVYVVGVSPARDSSFDTYDEHPGVYVSVMEGTTYADTLWRCTSNKGGTLGSSALVFEEFDAGGDIASESEAEEGTDNAKGMTPLRTHQAYFALESNPNLCFNPAGQSWQNDTTLTAMAHRTPLADGWLWGTDLGTSVWTGTRNADVPDSRYPYSVSVACTTSEASPAAGVDRHIRFAVYGKVFFPVSTANVKVGFWAKSKKTGVHSIACVNEGRTHTYVTEYTIAAADTWEWHEVTIPFGSKAGTWNVDDGYGFGLRFAVVTGSTYRVAAGSWQTGNYTGSTNQVNLGDSTSNYLRICGLQIHAERIPSFILPPFEAVYQEALKQYRVITTNVSGANLSIGLAPSANTVNFDMPLGMQMYAPPKISYKGTLNTDVVVYSATAALSGMTGFVSFERSRDMAKFTIEKTGGFSSGAAHYFRLETTSGKLVIDGHLA